VLLLALKLLLPPAVSVAAPLPPRDPRAGAFCARMQSNVARDRCLDEAGKKPGKSYDGVALGACESFPDDSDRVRCFIITREARSFEPGALGICSQLDESAARLACLGVIAGAWYRPSSLRQCRSASGNRDTVRCLLESRE
jgi:hypothetical protein